MVNHITAISDSILCKDSVRSRGQHLTAIAKVMFTFLLVSSVPGVYSIVSVRTREAKKSLVAREYLTQSRGLADKRQYADALILAKLASGISPRSKKCREHLKRLETEVRSFRTARPRHQFVR